MSLTELLRPGDTCWRVEPAQRVRLLVDGAEYYAALYRALSEARESVLILGWDIDSKVRLLRDDASHPLPVELGAFLTALVKRRRRLRINVLNWDYAMLYALEREPLPLLNLQWRTPRRLQFRLDGQHPVGASHHQKVVVVDDSLAFAGGLDLTRCRWDTSEHRPDDPRRVDRGEPYAPFHDLQLLVDGPAAAALGELARERWRRATGQTLRPVTPRELWPAGFAPDLEAGQGEGLALAISRTEPAYDGRTEVREVERLLLGAVAAAERYLYIENQYLTSSSISAALARSLGRPRGPEVLIVLPRASGGWLEQATMDVLRARVLQTLREADRHGRLRVVYPGGPGFEEPSIIVHGKLLIADDRWLCVGSANLSNRSMGLDTECNLSLTAADDGQRRALAGILDRLLAEHLGHDRQTVAAARAAVPDSLLTAVRQLSGAADQPAAGRRRDLIELRPVVSEALDQTVPDAALIDPERPVEMAVLAAELLPDEERRAGGGRRPALRRAALALALLALLVLALAALWRWTPLAEWLNKAALTRQLDVLRDSALTPLAVPALFVIAGLTAFPITLLIVATALVFGPLMGFAYSIGGCLLAAAAGYGVGRRLGRASVQRLIGRRLARLNRMLERGGVLVVAGIRNLPLAPFTLVNLLGGALQIKLRDFLLGTLIGMAPGMLALTVFADGVLTLINKPEPATVAATLGLIAAIGGLAWLVKRWLRPRGATRRSAGRRR